MNRQCLRGLRKELRERQTPLLGKGGLAAPINKISRSFLSGAQTGWLVQATDYRKLNEPPRPRVSKERGHFLDRASTPPLPPLPRRGVSLPIHPLQSTRRAFGTPELCRKHRDSGKTLCVLQNGISLARWLSWPS